VSVTIKAMKTSDIGLTDFTLAGLQAALDYVGLGGGGQIYVAPGTISLTSVLSVYSNTWLCGAGIGATIIKRTVGSVNVIQNKNFTGTPDSDILLSDMTLDGNASGGVGLNCVRFTNVTRGTVRACKLTNAQAEGVAIYGNGTAPGVNVDIKIDGCQFSNLLDSAIDVQDVNGLAVSGFCQFSGVTRSAINLEPNTATDQCISVAFSGNSYRGGTSLFGIVIQGDHSAGVQGVIRDCSFTGNTMDGGDVGVFFAGTNLDGIVLSGNAFTNQNKQAFWALNAHGITTGVQIVGNYVRNASTAGVGSYSAMEFANSQKLAVNLNRIQDDRGTPQHKYGIEFNAGSTSNWYDWNSVDGVSVGDIAPDAGALDFKTWGQYLHTGLLRVRNISTRYRSDLNRTGTALNINAVDDTAGINHPVNITQLATVKSSLTDAATIAVNASLGNVFSVTLGGNRTMGLPTNSATGQRITFVITQDGTGGRTLAWNANFKQAWSDVGNTASKVSMISFVYDSFWYQDGAQTPYI
jgi:hypothetical protein